MAQHDLVFRNALIADGSGAPLVHGDLAIDGDRIAAVGEVPGAGKRTIDLKGQVLSPGFIDVHTHDDFAAVLHPDMAFKSVGGVTSCVVGNCGFGAAPFAEAARMSQAFHPNATLPGWEGYRGYLGHLEANPPGVNIAALIGHGTVRAAVMGKKQTPPDTAEMRQMKAIIQEGLEAGCVGLSTGLIYEPGRHAQTDELVELTALLKGSDALYATHMRNESQGLLDSVNEAIEIGTRAGVPVQISHHKASGRPAWGLVKDSLLLIEAAQKKGLDVHADQYPYTAGSTVLSAVLGDGRLNDGLGRLTAEDVVIASSAGQTQWEGKTLAALAREMSLEPLDCGRRILEAQPGTTVVLHMMDEADVQTVLRHPSTMIGSDGIPTLEGRPHPRLYGTFARVLGHYCRDLKLFPIEEAVYRMTGFAAAKFRLEGRGLLRAGHFADLVVFDPKTVIDVGTYEDPNRMPAGIAHVFVNGIEVAAGGRHTGARPGKVLRRRN
ncbi:MAG: D-aminoacylase [Proteobacteria bacterium]|nr:D-aminoacylase [Pseudomonadota bacterium]